jgi:hypothetical protein
MNLPLICIVFAFVLSLLGAFMPYPVAGQPVPWYSRPNLLSLGFAFYMLSILLGGHRW